MLRIQSNDVLLPHLSPLYPPLPWHYHAQRVLLISCAADPDKMKDFLPRPLEVNGSQFTVFVLTCPRITAFDGKFEIHPYHEAGIHLPVKYKGTSGLCCAYLYVDTDEELAAGRELWGYPKKIANIEFIEQTSGSKLDEMGNKIVSDVTRLGTTIMKIRAEITGKEVEFPGDIPELIVKSIPKTECTARAAEIRKLVTVPKDVEVLANVGCDVDLEFGRSEKDPLYLLQPKVLGGAYLIQNVKIYDARVLEDFSAP